MAALKFWFNRCFCEISRTKLQKEHWVLHFTSIHMFSEIAWVFLGLANCKVYKCHLTKGYKRSTWWEL